MEFFMYRKSSIFTCFILILAIIMFTGCDRKESAKKEIEKKGITYNLEEFENALLSNNVELIDLFLTAGVDLSSEKVLHAVLSNANPEVFKKLLDAGMDPNSDIEGKPLIFTLVGSSKYDDLLKVLLEDENTNINITMSDTFEKNRTALHYAISSENFNAFELLLKKGANPKLVADDGGTSYDVSGSIFISLFATADFADEYEEHVRKAVHFVELMGKHFNPNSKIVYLKDGYEDSLLGWVIGALKEYRLAKLLIEKGANPNVIDINGDTLLHFLSARFDDDSLDTCIKLEKLLISYGVDSNIKNNSGKRSYIPCKDLAEESKKIKDPCFDKEGNFICE